MTKKLHPSFSGEDYPELIIHQITLFLPFSEVLKLNTTCKRFQQIILNHPLVKLLSHELPYILHHSILPKYGRKLNEQELKTLQEEEEKEPVIPEPEPVPVTMGLGLGGRGLGLGGLGRHRKILRDPITVDPTILYLYELIGIASAENKNISSNHPWIKSGIARFIKYHELKFEFHEIPTRGLLADIEFTLGKEKCLVRVTDNSAMNFRNGSMDRHQAIYIKTSSKQLEDDLAIEVDKWYHIWKVIGCSYEEENCKYETADGICDLLKCNWKELAKFFTSTCSVDDMEGFKDDLGTEEAQFYDEENDQDHISQELSILAQETFDEKVKPITRDSSALKEFKKWCIYQQCQIQMNDPVITMSDYYTDIRKYYTQLKKEKVLYPVYGVAGVVTYDEYSDDNVLNFTLKLKSEIEATLEFKCGYCCGYGGGGYARFGLKLTVTSDEKGYFKQCNVALGEPVTVVSYENTGSESHTGRGGKGLRPASKKRKLEHDPTAIMEAISKDIVFQQMKGMKWNERSMFSFLLAFGMKCTPKYRFVAFYNEVFQRDLMPDDMLNRILTETTGGEDHTNLPF
jgi:hypothetical protein